VLRLRGITSTGERDSLPLMLDGREDTYFYCRELQKAGDWFGVDLGGAREVRRIRITQGRNDSDHDRVYTGVLEGRTDDGGWQVLASKVDGTRIVTEPKHSLRALRVRNQSAETPGVVLTTFAVTTVEDEVGAAAILGDGDLGHSARISAEPVTLPLASAPMEAVFLLANNSGALEVIARTAAGEKSIGRITGPFARLSLPAATSALKMKSADARVAAQVYEVVPVLR
jgi:hypothetical protein